MKNGIDIILDLSRDDTESYTLIVKEKIKEYLKKDKKLYALCDFILIEDIFFKRLSEYYAGKKPELHGDNEDVVVDTIFVCLGHLFLIRTINIAVNFHIKNLLHISKRYHNYKTICPSEWDINFYQELIDCKLLDKSGEPRINYVFYKEHRVVLQFMLYDLLEYMLNKNV